jgi:hypothetical protein
MVRVKFSIPNIRDYCLISHQAAACLINQYADAGHVIEITGKTRYQKFKFIKYIELLSKELSYLLMSDNIELWITLYTGSK